MGWADARSFSTNVNCPPNFPNSIPKIQQIYNCRQHYYCWGLQSPKHPNGEETLIKEIHYIIIVQENLKTQTIAFHHCTPSSSISTHHPPPPSPPPGLPNHHLLPSLPLYPIQFDDDTQTIKIMTTHKHNQME